MYCLVFYLFLTMSSNKLNDTEAFTFEFIHHMTLKYIKMIFWREKSLTRKRFCPTVES